MRRRAVTIIAAALAVAIVPAGCSPTEADVLNVDGSGTTTIDNEAMVDAVNAMHASTIDDKEIAGILFMREEEKLARDVYAQLHDIWGTNIFGNIASSEQTHTDAVKSLIEKYGLDDPAEGQDVGVFTNDTLQQLHDDLIAQGNLSKVDALKVGAAIEEIDIIDIEKYAAETDNEDIQLVYENLIKGSRNHLRSFVSVLEKRGITYEPQYLDEVAFNAILTSDMERGGR